MAAAELEAMLEPMARRGPDRQTLACHGEAGFGHALLATTQEALAECQPWRHPDSGCLVISDSRLDNRPQLLRELGIDRAVDEVGDGELLHAAWQRWREGCADRLRGDFAFALWDPGRRELFIARDPMGVRPLLFHFDSGRLFVFASCTEAVLAQGDVPATLDEGRIADALIGETEGIDQTCTFFTAIQRLPPAHWMRLRDGQLVQQRYWRPIGDERPAGLPTTGSEWIEAQRECLDRAVRQRLRSQRPVGSMLSGGLDSSSVVALAAAACRERGQPPFPVFSATDAANPDCAETRAIRAVTAHVDCAPTFVDLADFKRTQTRAHQLWDEAGEPFDGTMPLLASLYEAAAARGVVSVMDGVPADNLYTVGRQAKYLSDQGRWGEAWQAALTQWRLPGIRFPQLHALRVMAGCVAPTPVHALRDLLAETREYRKLLRTSLIAPGFARQIDLRQRYRRYRRTIGGSHRWHPSGEALSSLAAPYITAGLERYNRLASLYGIEPRPPYADRDLIEFQAWMPLGLRIRDGHLKWVLRQAMVDRLPAEVAWRRDKSHIGWRFNRVLLDRALAGMGPETKMAGIGWLDGSRLDDACRHPDTQVAAGLQEALRVLQWHQRAGRPGMRPVEKNSTAP
ncbi:MAG: hypothetical protein J0M00_07465 [Burkholderiales bacterium]|nr:hypothetical protein [Burkholderiales bacterium]